MRTIKKLLIVLMLTLPLAGGGWQTTFSRRWMPETD